MSVFNTLNKGKVKNNKIYLDHEMTKEFYSSRESWGKAIQVVTSHGQTIILPWTAMPSVQHTTEKYFHRLSDGSKIEVLTAYPYYSLGGCLSRLSKSKTKSRKRVTEIENER